MLLLLLLRVKSDEDKREEEAGYYGPTVFLHNMQLNYKNYNLPEEDPVSVLIIENITAHDEYDGRKCATIQYHCNKTGAMSTKFQEDAIPAYWNSAKFYGGDASQAVKNTSH